MHTTLSTDFTSSTMLCMLKMRLMPESGLILWNFGISPSCEKFIPPTAIEPMSAHTKTTAL